MTENDDADHPQSPPPSPLGAGDNVPFTARPQADDGAPGPQPIEGPQGGRPEAMGPQPLVKEAEQAKDEEHADYTAEIKTYDDIRNACWAARRAKQNIIVVLGLATSGKSFFIRRFGRTLENTHIVRPWRGLPPSRSAEIDRTREILLYRFEPLKNSDGPACVQVFDVPGDDFAPLVRGGFDTSNDDGKLKLISVILALADIVIFVAPALQVLDQDLYQREGDDLKLTPPERARRVAELESFIDSLPYMRDAVGPLRRAAPRRRPKGRSPADEERLLDEAVEAMLKTPAVARKPSPAFRMPALLLLSRADELYRVLASGSEDVSGFDEDPAWQVVQRHKRYFVHLAERFDSFAADFITAEVGRKPTKVTDSGVEYGGVSGLVKGWINPAIRDARRPAWLNRLRSPSVAMRVRVALDPQFAKALAGGGR